MAGRTSRYNDEYSEKILARISATNRELAAEHLRAKRAQGVRPATTAGSMWALWELDQRTHGAPLREIQPATLTRILEDYSVGHSPATAHNLARKVKAFYAWLHDGECPGPIRRALRRQRVAEHRDVHPITKDEFESMLRAAPEHHESPRYTVRRTAFIWALWDTGFRISELLALRRRDVFFDDKGGARLTLPHDAKDLKTGPRSIYVVECAGPLKVWLGLHPLQHADAPLFPSFNNHAKPMNPSTASKVIEMTAKRAGIRHIHPHLFRHTRATRAAEAGWNEAQLRSYFGWGPRSPMASHYVHIAQSHMEERVRRDAQVDPLGARVQADPQKAIADVASAAAASSSAAMIKALMDAGVIPRPAREGRGDEDGGAAAPMARG